MANYLARNSNKVVSYQPFGVGNGYSYIHRASNNKNDVKWITPAYDTTYKLLARTGTGRNDVEWQSMVKEDIPNKKDAKEVFTLINKILDVIHGYPLYNYNYVTGGYMAGGRYHTYIQMPNNQRAVIGDTGITLKFDDGKIDYFHSKMAITFGIMDSNPFKFDEDDNYISLRDQINSYEGKLLFRSCNNCHLLDPTGDSHVNLMIPYTGPVYMGTCNIIKENDEFSELFYVKLRTHETSSGYYGYYDTVCLSPPDWGGPPDWNEGIGTSTFYY